MSENERRRVTSELWRQVHRNLESAADLPTERSAEVIALRRLYGNLDQEVRSEIAVWEAIHSGREGVHELWTSGLGMISRVLSFRSDSHPKAQVAIAYSIGDLALGSFRGKAFSDEEMLAMCRERLAGGDLEHRPYYALILAAFGVREHLGAFRDLLKSTCATDRIFAHELASRMFEGVVIYGEGRAEREAYLKASRRYLEGDPSAWQEMDTQLLAWVTTHLDDLEYRATTLRYGPRKK